MRSRAHLLGIAGVVVLAVVLDVLLFYYRPPDSLEILVVADGLILVGLAVDLILGLRQMSTHSNLFRRLAESAPRTDPPRTSSAAEELEPQGNPTGLAYHDSPEGLESPAFVCACGHRHRFLCLTCSMTAEKARKIKGTKWFEWKSDMKEVDY